MGDACNVFLNENMSKYDKCLLFYEDIENGKNISDWWWRTNV